VTNEQQAEQTWRVIENPPDGTSGWRARVVCGDGIETVIRALFVDSDVAQEYLALEARALELERERDRLVHGSTDAWVVQTLARCKAAERRIRELERAQGSLFEAIKHGDDDHQSWLREAIEAHLHGEAVPSPRSVINWKARAEAAESRVRELERDLSEMQAVSERSWRTRRRQREGSIA